MPHLLVPFSSVALFNTKIFKNNLFYLTKISKAKYQMEQFPCPSFSQRLVWTSALGFVA